MLEKVGNVPANISGAADIRQEADVVFSERKQTPSSNASTLPNLSILYLCSTAKLIFLRYIPFPRAIW